MAYGSINHNSLEPGSESCLIFIRIQISKSLYKRVLQDVLRIFHILRHSQTDIVHRFRVLLVQIKLCIAIIPFASLDGFV